MINNMDDISTVNEILIVDDTPENLHLLCEILTAHGYRVRPSADSQLGLEAAIKKVPDLILLDVRMPKMDGFEVCRQLKANPITRNVPVIFISVIDEPTDKTAGFNVGGVDFISRPFEPLEVLARVKTHLTIQSTQHTLKVANSELQTTRKELEQLNADLEERVRNRTAELEIANRDLQQSEERYRDIVEGTTDLIARFDKNGRISFVNHFAEKTLGLTNDQSIGQSIFQYLKDSEQPVIKDWFLRCVQDGANVASIETRLVSRSRDIREMIWTVNFHYNAIGNFDYANLIARDITAIKMEERIQAAQVRLIEYAAQHTVNELLQRFLDEVELLTGSDVGFYHFVEEDQETLSLQSWSTNTLENMCKAQGARRHYPISEAGVWVECVRLRSSVIHNDYAGLPNKKGVPKGHAKIIRELVVPVIRRDKIVAILGVGNKLTNYDSGDESVIRRMAELAWEMVVRKRAEEEKTLVEQKFYQAQKMESIGRLAGGVAHDLNNLLTPIIGFGDILRDEFTPNDRRKQKIEMIYSAGIKAQGIVRQLLAFSRKQTLEYKSLDLNEAIQGFRKLLDHTLRDDISLEVITDANIKSIMGDVGQIEQVIMNLAVNAQDAMETGGTITMETAMVDLDEDYAATHPGVVPGEYVMLSVSDTGCGMDEEIRNNVFEPFYTTKGEQGTGLGLSTVFGIVKQHRGSVWLYSELGIGTTFKIYLPVSEKIVRGEQQEPKLIQEVTANQTVLIAEDDDHVRKLCTEVLTNCGYRVRTARTGTEAIAYLASCDRPVDLLVTDVVMPKMNGKELYEKLVLEQPQLKVLYMSGYTYNVIAQHGVLNHGVSFIQKPFTAKTLAAKVREVLAQTE